MLSHQEKKQIKSELYEHFIQQPDGYHDLTIIGELRNYFISYKKTENYCDVQISEIIDSEGNRIDSFNALESEEIDKYMSEKLYSFNLQDRIDSDKEDEAMEKY